MNTQSPYRLLIAGLAVLLMVQMTASAAMAFGCDGSPGCLNCAATSHAGPAGHQGLPDQCHVGPAAMSCGLTTASVLPPAQWVSTAGTAFHEAFPAVSQRHPTDQPVLSFAITPAALRPGSGSPMAPIYLRTLSLLI